MNGLDFLILDAQVRQRLLLTRVPECLREQQK